MATVLLAEDDQPLLDMYSIWLDRTEAVSVRTATDGAEAAERIDESVDVAILDRRMPGMTGDEVAQYIRDTPVDCEVIMVSAFEPDRNIEDAAYDRYLTKPVDAETLVSAIDGELNEPILVDQ